MPETNLDREQTISRGNFIQAATKLLLIAAGFLGLGGLIRFFSHQPQGEKPAQFDLGMEEDFPSNGQWIRLDIPGVIFQENGTFLGFNLTCPHLGCMLEELEDNFICPCHGSEFSKYGSLIKGPAEQDLTSLSVEVNPEGKIIVDTRGQTK
jgi:cytochrome b6-f complex iron-sulfur subunit